MMKLFAFCTLLSFLFWYTLNKGQRSFAKRKTLGRLLGVSVFLAALLWQFVYRFFPEIFSTFSFKLMVQVGSIALGWIVVFWLLSWIQDGISYGIFFPLQQALIDPIRRAFLKKSIARVQKMTWSVVGTSVFLETMGFRQAHAKPQVRFRVIPIDQLPPVLEQLTWVQLSDLHVGPTIQRVEVERWVEQVNALSPDWIGITGDLLDGSPKELMPHLAPLKNLKARFGVDYVTGNHEYYWGVQRWLQPIRDLGFNILHNENRVFDYQGSQVLIAGVPDISIKDYFSEKSDPRQAAVRPGFESIPLRILLAHHPESCWEAERAGFHLQLSGHTHGGQFFPLNILIRCMHRYSQGLYRHGNLWLYVNTGLGYWGPANRLGVPAEITQIRFQSTRQTSQAPQGA